MSGTNIEATVGRKKPTHTEIKKQKGWFLKPSFLLGEVIRG